MKENWLEWWEGLDLQTRNFLWVLYDQTSDIKYIYEIEHRNKK